VEAAPSSGAAVRRPGYGESQPPLQDDRLPVVLLILDGLGDRPVPELAGRTPAEAARTPVLDELVRRGASGWHVPFGWGRAPSSELSHWALFGYGEHPFPGRAVLEGLGAGVEVPYGVAAVHGALRTSTVDGDLVRVTGRAAAGDGDDAARLIAELALTAAKHSVLLHPLRTPGEVLLLLPRHAHGDVSDSDPFFEQLHPWLRPLASAPEAEPLAADLRSFLLQARAVLTASEANAARLRRGLPALDLLTTKWAGVRRPLPSFAQVAGVPGGAVISSGLYRGFARLLGLARRELPSVNDLTREMTDRVAAGIELLGEGAAFVHVHTKAPDEAGHSKQPYAKRDALEAIDAGLAPLLDLAGAAVVAVTGDHATPSTGRVLHTGDPSPFVVAGGAVRADGVSHFGEASTRHGDLGILRAVDVLPLLFSAANRPAFLGHRTSAFRSWALPDDPDPFRLRPGEEPGGAPVLEQEPPDRTLDGGHGRRLPPTC
jgi:2,3-bisphosphoglycerate-independent phosphoglycerate mutase